MNVLEGRCPQCGVHYRGWALQSQRNQMCEYCGAALEIKEAVLVGSGSGALKADGHLGALTNGKRPDWKNRNLLIHLMMN
jgi:uncharacterized protein (DUF983 family)